MLTLMLHVNHYICIQAIVRPAAELSDECECECECKCESPQINYLQSYNKLMLFNTLSLKILIDFKEC